MCLLRNEPNCPDYTEDSDTMKRNSTFEGRRARSIEGSAMAMNRFRRVASAAVAALASVLMLAYSPPASADAPECPCWDGVAGLAEFLGGGVVRVCDAQPQIRVTTLADGRKRVSASSSALSTAGRSVLAETEHVRGEKFAECCTEIFNPGPPSIICTPVDVPEVRACLRQINDLCSQLDF